MEQTKPKKNNYVDNAALYDHMVKRRARIKAAKDAGLEPPSLQDDRYLGQVILDIAKNLSYRRNFINYSFKPDMISDAIENLVRVVDNFDPEKSKYPFSYMTMVAFQAMVRRIQTEEKQQRIKGALIDRMLVDDLFDSQEHDEDGVAYKTHFIEYLREHNFIGKGERVTDKTTIKDPEGLEVFMVDDETESMDGGFDVESEDNSAR